MGALMTGHLLSRGHEVFAFSRSGVPAGLIAKGAKAGVDLAKMRQALTGGLATSRILELLGDRMIKRTFNPSFRIELHQKDRPLARERAKAMGLSRSNTSNAQQLMNSCVVQGGAAWDHSGLVRALEIVANFEISPAPTHAL